jgi:protein arginine N-methyltransferase 1
MYSLAGYGRMIADRVRTEAYQEALRRSVRPGSVVVEIGTGPGAFAVLACQLGARRVYAFEPDPVIQVAREIAAANGCADRIEFIEDFSTNVTLPEQADVIVSDLRGVLPLFPNHLNSIADARRRFLAPGGLLIPKRDDIWASIVESPEQFAEMVDAWDKNILGLNLAPARRLAVNDFKKATFRSEQLLAEARLWASLDYATSEPGGRRSKMNFSIQRPGTGHGIVCWFDACLIDGIGFSNAPGKPEAIYGSMFLPWVEPVSLVAGQTLSVDLEARLVQDDYLWRWMTRIDSTSSSAEAVRFEQSQVAGVVISPERLRRFASDSVPRLSEDGRVNRRTLELMDGTKSLESIARTLAFEFPHRFTHWQQALGYAAKRSQEHSL